jgi:hypothetical protein
VTGVMHDHRSSREQWKDASSATANLGTQMNVTVNCDRNTAYFAALLFDILSFHFLKQVVLHTAQPVAFPVVWS